MGHLAEWAAPSGFTGRSGELRTLPATAGRLGAMRCTDVAGAHVDDLSRATEIGTTYAVTWVDVPDRDARTVSTRRQFGNDQITRSRKFEGAWWGPDGAGGQGGFIVCSYARTAATAGTARVAVPAGPLPPDSVAG